MGQDQIACGTQAAAQSGYHPSQPATPAEIPAGSAVAAQAAGPAPQTAEDIEIGRKLGAEIAKQLTTDVRAMGLPAVQAAGQPPPRVDDIVIKGQFVTIDEGRTGRRLLVGFGSGAPS